MSYREKRRESYQGMSSGQLRRKIFQMMTFIDGQFSGGFDRQDMYDEDMGHLATLVDMIDVYNMSNPDNRMEYPKTRDETFSPIDWTPYMMNESRTVRITKGQLRRIIKEEKKKLQEQTRGPSEAQIEDAVSGIERELNRLYDQGMDNAGLHRVLDQIKIDIDRGFVGEPR